MGTNTIEMRVSKLENLELFLLHLRYKESRLLEVEGNKPLLLNDPDTAWVVYSGTIDVFAVPVQESEVVGTRSHLFRSSAGQLLLGTNWPNQEKALDLLVTGVPGTRLLRLKQSRLKELAADIEYSELISAMLDDWVAGLSVGIFREIRPKEITLLEPGHTVSLEKRQVAIPQKEVVWIRLLTGRSYLMGQSRLSLEANHQVLPVASNTWLEMAESASLETTDTAVLIGQDTIWAGLEKFHKLALDAIALYRAEAVAIEHERLQKKAASEQLVMEQAISHLTSALATTPTTPLIAVTETGQNALLAACQLVGQALGLEVQPYPGIDEEQSLATVLENISRVSRFRKREVALKGEWWRRDNGPLLAFLEEGQQPVALILASPRRYNLINPVTNISTPVTMQVAGGCMPIAYTFYVPLPNQLLTGRDLLRFGLKNNRQEVIAVLVISSLIGLFSLLPPIVTSFIFDQLIPEAEINGLLQVGIGLFAIAVSLGLLQVARGIAMLRLQSKMDASLQAALWDRLLSLPAPFFRRFSAGSLGVRATGITSIRRILSGYVITTVLTSVFSIFNIVLLFFYSTRLALAALGLILLAFGATLLASYYYIRYQRELNEVQANVAGLVLQLLTGVVKFRAAGAEHQAFALWSQSFTQQKRLYYKARLINNNLGVFNAGFPLIMSLVIFSVIAFSSELVLSTGDFLAFILALSQFLGAWIMLSSTLVSILVTVPIYEQMKPILQTEPEVDETKVSPGKLSGEIEVSHVSFRYSENSPLVLKDVSLDIQSGEFVALVGPSGSGKSTLMRLLLGFDHPETGGIYYDNQSLADLDLREVRRQLGVVLQSATLMSGDVFENIVGASSGLTIDDAWDAARMVGLDKDVEDMPMGMNTLVSERGSNFSGGQRQRILIARAIVNRPRLIFFDEATSALDNQTQEIVSRSLEGLKATRVVIAHRLSTIVNADRIFVFEASRIVQVGSYDELIRQPGPFAELARRQIA